MGRETAQDWEPGTTQQQPREEDDKEHAEVQEDRQDGDNYKDKEILQHILDARNHKIRRTKGNLSLWSMNMPLL